MYRSLPDECEDVPVELPSPLFVEIPLRQRCPRVSLYYPEFGHSPSSAGWRAPCYNRRVPVDHHLLVATRRHHHPGFSFSEEAFVKALRSNELVKANHQALRKLVKGKRRIVIFGDYDADGVVSALLMWKFLGHEAKVVLPVRAWGYGLSAMAVEHIAAMRPDLVILLDNGIKSHAEVEQLRTKLNAQVAIIDHHAATPPYPPADLVIHPDLLPALEGACTTGLVWAIGSLWSRRSAEDEQLGALGTLADSVPLQGFNFGLARLGLLSYRRAPNHALAMLAEREAYSDLPSSSIEDMWRYLVIPAINAAGRIADPALAFSHLAAPDEVKAAALVKLNDERKALMRRCLDVIARDAAWPYPFPGVLVCMLSAEACDSDAEKVAGVVGLVAQRLSAWYMCPAIALTDSPGDPAALVGSMRMPEGWDGLTALDVLRALSHHLTRYGGHAKAAGLTLQRSQARAFIEEAAQARVGRPLVRYDAKVNFKIFSWIYTDHHLQTLLQRMRPFGVGNPPLRLWTTDAVVQAERETPTRLFVTLRSVSSSLAMPPLTATWWEGDHCFPPSLRGEAIAVLQSPGCDLVLSPLMASAESAVYTCDGLQILSPARLGEFVTSVNRIHKEYNKFSAVSL